MNNNILEPIDEVIENPILEDKLSKVVNKFTAGEKDVESLFSPSDDYKYGEIIVDNDIELPSINFMDNDAKIVSLHEVCLSEGDDISVVSEIIEGKERFTISHKPVELGEKDNNKDSVENDINVITNIVVSKTGHITDFEKGVICKTIK